MSISEIHPWHETISSPRSVIQDGVARRFFFGGLVAYRALYYQEGVRFGIAWVESTRTHPLLTLRALPLLWRDLLSSYGFCLGPSGSTMVPSDSTAEGSQAAVPLLSGGTGGDSAAVLLMAYQVPTASIRGIFSVSDCAVPRRGYSAAVPLLSGSAALPLRWYRPVPSFRLPFVLRGSTAEGSGSTA